MAVSEPQSRIIDAPSDYPFPKEHGAHIPWSQVLGQLQQAENYWLATVRPDGRPHVAPLWGVWLDDGLYFEGSPETRWARNLAANPAASVNLEDGNNVVIVEGAASFIPLSDELRATLIQSWAGKYGMYGPNAETDGIFRLDARVVRAWGEAMTDGARWMLA